MSDPPPDQGRVRDRSTPGWVKLLGIVVLVLLVILVVSRLLGIEHGPDLHSDWLVPEGIGWVAAAVGT